MNPVRILRRLGQLLPRFVRDRRGSADLNTYLLLTAAGCTMVGLTAPHLFKSSKTASDTFEKQVEILQRGSSGGAGGASGGAASGGDWNLGGQGGLSQLAGSLGGSGAQLSGSGGQLSGSGSQLASGSSALAGAGGPKVTAAAAPVVAGAPAVKGAAPKGP